VSHGIRPELVKHAVKVDELTPYPGNARRGDVDAIAESLEAHGQYRPIVVRRETKEVLAGNHTLRAAVQLKWTHVAVTYVDVDEEQAARIVLVDNRTNDAAGYDDQALADLLKPLQESENGLIGTGFDAEACEALLESLKPAEPEPPAEDDPEPAVYAVGVACATEEDRANLISQLEEWGYNPRKVDGRWAGQITE
jgi:ParB-like chromosome segregation protein Spo0J